MVAQDNNGVCISANCKNRQRCRGLCGTCYWNAIQMIKSGRVESWKWLESHGLAWPRKTSPLAAAVEKQLSLKASRKKRAAKSK